MKRLAWRRCSLWLLACLIAGCTPPASAPPTQAFAQHVYIWQRVWRPAHTQALRQSQPDFSQLRVLSLQFHVSRNGPSWTFAAPDWALLARDQRPVTLVLRLDGQLSQLPDAAMVWQQLQPQVDAAQRAGVNLAAIEIDYDAARAALASYRQWLLTLRQQLPTSVSLQITALPDWLQSKDYPALCQVADQLTLQLHSVLSPAQGLFDSNKAKQWTQNAATTPCPLFLALPAYHSALITTADGDRVESETPLSLGGERRALLSRPEAVADFLRWLQSQSLPQLQGIVWFRLPLSDDQRSWPLPTLQALARREALVAKLQTELKPDQGRFDITLQNNGNLSAQLPDNLSFRGLQCIGGDAHHGYQWRQQGSDWHLQRQPAGAAVAPELAPAQRLTIAWLRCQQLQISNSTTD